MIEEEKLIKAAIKGDRYAMKRLYQENYTPVWRLAGRYTGNPEDAQDIVQEVFIKAFDSLGKFRLKGAGKGSFGAWVYRICINMSINFIKKSKSRQMTEYKEGEGILFSENTPDRIYTSDEAGRKVAEAMESLSPKQKMVFVLKHFEGFKIVEIAEKMECSSGSVKKQLFRATKKLKENLKGVLLLEDSKNEM